MSDRRQPGRSAIPAQRQNAYLVVRGGQMGRGTFRGGTLQMAGTNRLHHDVEIARRVTLTLSADFVLAAFVVLAAAVTLYDIGKWLAVW